MLQIKTFELPHDEEKMNAFLRAHRPEGEIIFSNNIAKVFFQDGVYGPGQEIGDLTELLMSCYNLITQKEVMCAVLEGELAILRPRREERDQLEVRLKEIAEEIKTASSGIAQLKKAERPARLEKLQALEEKKKELAEKANALTHSANECAQKENALKDTHESGDFTKMKIEYLVGRIEKVKTLLPKETEYEEGETTEE